MSIIQANEHVFVAGKTGTGKTFFVKKYLANYKNVTVLDTKGLIDWNEIPDEEVSIIKNIKDIYHLDTPKIIYRPCWEEMNQECYNEFFKFVYESGEMIVWIDEVMSIATNNVIPEFYKACLTRGREMNIGVWSLTQRPSTIPVLTMSESKHFIIFDLNMPQDRERITLITGQPEFLSKPSKKSGEKYSFWYHNVELDGIGLGILKEG